MGRKLTIPYYRPTFVQKELSEVGDGTAWPMECTLDQIAEIFYRVKDARFISGKIGHTYSGTNVEIRVPSMEPPQRAYFPLVSNSQARGYCFGPTADDEPDTGFFTASYDSGQGPGSFYRDVGDDELGMWSWPLTVSEMNHGGKDMHNAFSYVSGATGIDSPPPSPEEEWVHSWDVDGSIAGPAYGDVSFDGGVGVVKADPENDMLDPTNTFYLGIVVYLEWFPDSGPGFWGSTDISLVGTPYAACNYVIRLESGDIQCPFYVINDVYDSVYGEDLIHEATEWWPYNTEADGSGDPVWDTLTGAKL